MTIDQLTQRRQDLRDQILMHGPEKFDMAAWARTRAGTKNMKETWAVCEIVRHVDINDCGTTCCLAGHGALVIGEASKAMEPHQVAQYFGLPYDAFYFGNWHDIKMGDGTLRDVWNETRSQWETILAYLDDLIKSEGTVE